MQTQADKAVAFRDMHSRAGAFVIPNPWDAGSARLLAGLGFEALATTSAGYAFSEGQTDEAIGREQMMRHIASVVSATDLPVSADLRNGFGDDPETVAETIQMALNTGLAGASIEDSRTDPEHPVYDHALAKERIQSAVVAARSASFPFVLTARAENFLMGRPDLNDTIRRLQLYQDAGADVLFAPGLRTREDIAAVVGSVDKPVNVIMGLQGVALSVAELSDIGVKRISVGSALARAALTAMMNAALEIRDRGTFAFAEHATGFFEFNRLFARRASQQ